MQVERHSKNKSELTTRDRDTTGMGVKSKRGGRKLNEGYWFLAKDMILNRERETDDLIELKKELRQTLFTHSTNHGGKY